MLVVHPSSQCDVCLDAYNWSTPAKAPHAIQCGHIFCYDCLRSTIPSNCPMCRKAFNPERIKKLHVDRASGDSPVATGRMAEENEFLRRVGLLFAEEAEDEDINSLVTEVTDWLAEHVGITHVALRNAITALHQYKALQVQGAIDKETIERLRQTHERHAHVKQMDLDTAMIVERNMLLGQEKMREDYEAKLAELRDQNARIQNELTKYTNIPNPLPRPPEMIPLVTNPPRELASSSGQSAQRGVISLGLGLPPAPASHLSAPAEDSAPVVTAPTSQSRSSSGGSRGRAPSVHFSDTALPSAASQPKYKVNARGETLRQENTRRPPGLVPDTTPRPPLASVPVPPNPNQVPISSKIYWPPHLQQYAPKPGEPCVWLGPPGVPHEVLPNEVPLESLRTPHGGAPTYPVDDSGIPPVIPPPPVPPTVTARPPAETGSARMRVAPPDGPMSGRSPMAYRPGPAHKEGHVMAYLPEIGISWIPEEQAAKLPVRARGTESRYAYVIAKDPSEVDEEWRMSHNDASPAPNPLQLSGVPEAPVAGPNTSVVQRGGYDPLPGTSTAVSTLFLNPHSSSDRTAITSASSSNSSLNAMGILAPPANNSRLRRSAPAQNSTGTVNGHLGLNIASFPDPGRSTVGRAPEESETNTSPASSWGSIATRNSSLGNLNLHNLPPPHPFAPPSDSLDQLPIGELNGGPIVLTDGLTPRQSSSHFGDDRSISGRSEPSRSRHAEPSGLLLNPSAGSSRQVVNSMRDLEDVNRSLMQLTDSQEREPEPRRSSRPSTRHSRQLSMNGTAEDGDVMVGSRTGLALYSSRAPTQHPSAHQSGDPSPEEVSPPPAQSRPRSGASTRSHAESTYSSQSHHSSHSGVSNQSARSGNSSHRSSDAQRHRPRRSSTVSALDGFREPVSSWTTTVPADHQPYGSSRENFDSHSQRSQDSIPRAMEGMGSGPASMSSLLLSFDPPSTSSAVTESGEEAAGIHAPRPVNGRRSSLFGSAWTARNGR